VKGIKETAALVSGFIYIFAGAILFLIPFLESEKEIIIQTWLVNPIFAVGYTLLIVGIELTGCIFL